MKEQEELENEMMPNGGKSRGLFKKSRKQSQTVLTTRGIIITPSVKLLPDSSEGLRPKGCIKR